ncbi:MAG: LysM peptidoglycan-binding domain-containing protein [Firmicutes bacterium]|nr:LysM peptidoglycan-binding domain-containing protein [Bacillota bacterium]
MRSAVGKRVAVYCLLVAFFTSGSVARGKTYYAQPGDSLYSIAARYGTSIAALMRNNDLQTTAIYPGQALRLTRQNWSEMNEGAYWTRAGESLLVIAARHRISVTALKEANNLKADYVTAGRRLIIPAPYRNHLVQPGESLHLIAQKYGVTVKAIQEANQLSGDIIWGGQTLRIPFPRSEAPASGGKTYPVGYGEPLSLIAARHGISLESLLKANNLNYATPVLPGQRLIIPKESIGGGAGKYHLSQSDYDLFARLVSAEAAGEPFEGQVAVAASILNRLKDPRYPDTLYEIIYQVDNGKYQYSPVLDGRIELPATPSAYQAVEQALAGADPSKGANGFYNPAKTSNQWVRSQPVTAVIGNHVFYRY